MDKLEGFKRADYFRVAKSGYEIFNTVKPGDVVEFFVKHGKLSDLRYRIEARMDDNDLTIVCSFTPNQFRSTYLKVTGGT